MARSKALPESKIRRRRRARRLRLFVLLGILFLILLGAIVGLSWLPYIRIQGVVVSGAQHIATSSIEAYASAALSSRTLLVFPSDNIFFYPKRAIQKGLLSEFPALSGAEVKARDFNTIDILIAERRPSARWCGESPAAGEPCLLMDESGFAYGTAADFSLQAYFSYYGEATSTPGFAGSPKQFLTPAEFRALFALVQALARNQEPTEVSRIVVDPVSDVRMSFANGFSVIFALKDAGGDVYERFTLALVSDPFQKRKLSEFEYLDLRFGDKLYYHLKR